MKYRGPSPQKSEPMSADPSAKPKALQWMPPPRHKVILDPSWTLTPVSEELERMWPECFEHKYGYLRKQVVRAIHAFLDCGIPENGVARVFCDGCGRDYFVAFSCRMRVACPSCSTKRSILFGEKIRELVRPISHLHVTFTIPTCCSRGITTRGSTCMPGAVSTAPIGRQSRM